MSDYQSLSEGLLLFLLGDMKQFLTENKMKCRLTIYSLLTLKYFIKMYVAYDLNILFDYGRFCKSHDLILSFSVRLFGPTYPHE